MKNLIILLVTISLSSASFAQEQKEKGRFGAAINSNIHGVIGKISVAPTGTYYINKSQFEAGLCLYPNTNPNTQMIGGSLDYKYFPNGIDKRFSLYFNTHINYTNARYDYNYYYYYLFNSETKYNYLSLTGGYGFQVKFLKSAYIGTNLNVGISTNSVQASSPSAYNRTLFERYEFEGAFRINIGYRF